jgi:fructose-bisphosphate aldolase class II
MLVNLKQLLDHAAEHNYALAAFNIYNLETIRAVFEVSYELNSPVLLQLSTAARDYAGDESIFRALRGFSEMYPDLPFAIHQDHGHNLEVCRSAVSHGATSVMRDGSLGEDKKTPLSFEENVRVTKEAVDCFQPLNVSVEGELGCLGSLETLFSAQEDGHGAVEKLDREMLLTDPFEAEEFCQATGVTALAVAIGTSHGAAKFASPPNEETLALEQLKKISEKCLNTHLVLHGASSVPENLQDLYRRFGGQLEKSWGVPEKSLLQAIQLGVRKINIDTDCRLAFSVGVRKYLFENPVDFNPREYLRAGLDSMKSIVAAKLILFNQADQASEFPRSKPYVPKTHDSVSN